MRHHRSKPGIPTVEEVEEFYATWCTDLYEICGRGRNIHWHHTGESIKVLARLAGFDWKWDDAGGDTSIVKFDTARFDPDPKKRAEAINWLRVYNRDDVLAQVALRGWLRQDMPAHGKP